ncbi:S9 family peptidase [Tautonia sp. JC769]|uniref:S9 family peptidase n=1 Tax=Tautonia sp. JC769 TaxID=3232135 RepID=UPI0034587D7F
MSRTVRPRSRAGLAWVLCCAAVPAIAQGAFDESPSTFTPELIARLRVVTQAAASPDGGQIAYVLAVPRDLKAGKDGPAWTELHLVDGEGRSRPFVTGEVNVSQVAWTPDGSGISFVAKRGNDEQPSLYVIPVDGGEARRVLAHKEAIASYSWSPDGDRVAFLSSDSVPDEQKKLRDQGFTQRIFEEEWQPVRVLIAELGDDAGDPKALELDGSASELSWSPDGEHLAVALAPTPSVDDSFMKRKVHVIEAESGEVVRALDNPGKLGAVRWSPDGTRLALISAADLNDPSPGRVLVGSIDDGTLTELAPGHEGQFEDLTWLDETTLLALSSEGVQTTLRRLSVDDPSQSEVVVEGPVILNAIHHPHGSQAIALVGETPKHPAEVYRMDPDASEPERLTHHNTVLDDLRFAEQEVITYTARDGLEIEGILIHPLDREEGARSPLILYVHGGPEAHDRNGWLTGYATPGQLAASRGFAVFYPNYRGSTGRGVEFSKLGQADAAGKEFDDLVDAIDHLDEVGLIDPEKVGITGGSYGGYASAWGATYYSDRFAAAVMFVGISDKLSKAGTTDIPEEEYLVHARKRPWDDWQFFLQRSPIHHVTKARTPILILHGEDDPRVHPAQSLELFRYLKLVDQAPVRLVLYPGEGHGNRRAASRYDYNLRMIRWMEHYLKGEGGDPPPLRVEYEALGGDSDS